MKKTINFNVFSKTICLSVFGALYYFAHTQVPKTPTTNVFVTFLVSSVDFSSTEKFPGSSENPEEEPPSGGDGGHLLFWLLYGLPVWLHSRLSIWRHLPIHLHGRPRLPEAQERQE